MSKVHKASSSSEYAFAPQVKHLVFNILKNASYVVDACKCKTLSETHLKAVSIIQANIRQQKISYIPASEKRRRSASPPSKRGRQSGGHMGTVMPSEYYGIDSGAYKDIAEIQPNEVQLFADSAYARAEHPIKVLDGPMFGGAGGNLDSSDEKHIKALVKAYVKEYVAQKGVTFTRVSKEAMATIVGSVRANVESLKAATLKKYGAVTGGNVKSVIQQGGDFIHMKI